jgi:alkylation response protein AidB-like acyl-CoA dehydrogenase
LRETVRVQAAQAAALCEAARLSSYALVDQRVRGHAIGAEASAARFATVTSERAVTEFVVEFAPEALSGEHPLLVMHHQRAIVAGIASGAAEIQLNLVASDVLELPKEPR